MAVYSRDRPAQLLRWYQFHVLKRKHGLRGLDSLFWVLSLCQVLPGLVQPLRLLCERQGLPEPAPLAATSSSTAAFASVASAVSARQGACAAARSPPSAAALCPLCRLGLEHIHRPHHEWRYVREFWSDADRQHVRVHHGGGSGQRGPWKEWTWF